MKLIKLDAIDSTNDFLKSLNNQEFLENFTMVTAENQTKGKGQRGAVWNSEAGKNLILSILVKDFTVRTEEIFNLSIIVSLAVVHVLEEWNIPELSIKWPNDIMSYNKKIGGILIENTLKSDGTMSSIVGIGLNVNQTHFENLSKASSLAVICNKEYDKSLLPKLIVLKIQELLEGWNLQSEMLWEIYFSKLFKKGIPMPFKNVDNQNFMGIIIGVSPSGKLQIQLEDDSIKSFEIKEVTMLF